MEAKLIECVTAVGGHRFYRIRKGEEEYKLPSVTTILKNLDKPALIPWAVKSTIEFINESLRQESKKSPALEVSSKSVQQIFKDAKSGYKAVSKKATDIGTEVHEAIETYLKEKIKPKIFNSREAENGFTSFLQWELDNDFDFIESEILTYNVEHEYAGTTDCIGMLKGKKYLIDFKTSKGFYDEYPMQLAAYTFAYNQLNPNDRVKGMGILRLDKLTGRAFWKDYTRDAKKHLDMFLSLCKYHKLKTEIERCT